MLYIKTWGNMVLKRKVYNIKCRCYKRKAKKQNWTKDPWRKEQQLNPKVKKKKAKEKIIQIRADITELL